ARRRANPVKFADREILNEGRSHLRRDDELSVRLAVVRGELRQELVVGDAGGGGQIRLAQEFCSDDGCDLRRARDALDVFSDVQIGLIERQWLNDFRVLGGVRVPADREDRPTVSVALLVYVE